MLVNGAIHGKDLITKLELNSYKKFQYFHLKILKQSLSPYMLLYLLSPIFYFFFIFN